jgi:hypothetical protein
VPALASSVLLKPVTVYSIPDFQGFPDRSNYDDWIRWTD